MTIKFNTIQTTTVGGGALRFIDISGGGCDVLIEGALSGVRGRTKFPRGRCLF